MGLEHEKETNGAKIYLSLAHEHLDGSQKVTVSLGVRITKPTMASMDDFEESLRLYDQDRERCERLSGQSVGELAFVHLQDMISQEVRGKFENEKHNSRILAHFREFFDRVIEDFKANGRVSEEEDKKRNHEVRAQANPEREDQVRRRRARAREALMANADFDSRRAI